MEGDSRLLKTISLDGTPVEVAGELAMMIDNPKINILSKDMSAFAVPNYIEAGQSDIIAGVQPGAVRMDGFGSRVVMFITYEEIPG